jgi:hypothetical protein
MIIFVVGKFYKSLEDTPQLLKCIEIDDGRVSLEFLNGGVWTGTFDEAREYLEETKETWDSEK